MAKDNSMVFIIIVAVLAAYFLNLGGMQDSICSQFNLCMGSTAAPAPSPAAVVGTQDICVYDGATMTIGPMKERWNPSTSVAAFAARVYVNGVDRGLKVDSATMSVNYRDQIDIYYAENASATQYYTGHESFKVPCTSAFSSAEMGSAEELVAVESSTNALSPKVFNDDDGDLNIATNNESLGSGDVVQLRFTWQPTFEDGFAPFCQGVTVAEGNSTTYDKLQIVGWEIGKIPNQHTLTATTNEAWAYKIPMMAPPADGAYAQQSDSLLIDVANVNPGDTNNDIILKWYDCDWYRNSDTNKMVEGVEDDVNADVGRATITTTIYVY